MGSNLRRFHLRRLISTHLASFHRTRPPSSTIGACIFVLMACNDNDKSRKETWGMPRTEENPKDPEMPVLVLEDVRTGELPASQVDRMLPAITKFEKWINATQANQDSLNRRFSEFWAPQRPNPAPPYGPMAYSALGPSAPSHHT